MIGGDLNGYGGKHTQGCKGVHGGMDMVSGMQKTKFYSFTGDSLGLTREYHLKMAVWHGD